MFSSALLIQNSDFHSIGSSTFYDFVFYKQGPHSFRPAVTSMGCKLRAS